jgi:hypothetical protein
MYKFLQLPVVQKFVPEMERQGVSIVARSPVGFLTAYRGAGGRQWRLSATWLNKRDAFIARHMAQVVANDEPLYGKDKMPTRRHLSLIAWAFSPEATHITNLSRKLP